MAKWSVNCQWVEECLDEFAADEAEQRRIWLLGSRGIRDPVECMCCLYDDSVLGFALDQPGAVVFSLSIDAKLRDLAKVADDIDFDQSASTFITDPRVKPLRALAREILTDIQALAN
jgi:hypothetical protein